MREKQRKRRREERCSSSSTLSTEIIPQYFYMPMTRQYGACTFEEKVQGARSWWASMLATPAIEQTALMAENLTSDAPGIWCDQYLLRILTERGRNTISPLVKTEDYLESVSPLSRPHHFEFRKDPVPLWRVWFLHPRPYLEHIALRVDSTGNGDCDYSWRIMILKGAEGFICKGNNLLSYLYKRVGWWHLIYAGFQGMLRTRRFWLNFQHHPQP